ncbi:hypothetical protein BC937DRAFT_93292 [Endogone sp. FLAS-F59071]|nr:hypothetical protein BC937DRAFT_93292 [Endogone sp. FLAS-F59071]|eukprot:RUS21218.1 hypothetical protein BC937DRAFT_93292 [Endogone sp. FLAS-F59071]
MDILDTLNEDQKHSIAQFQSPNSPSPPQSITQIEDLDRAVHTLADNDWNLETAIQSIFEGSSQDVPTPTTDSPVSSTLDAQDQGPRVRSTSPATAAAAPLPPPPSRTTPLRPFVQPARPRRPLRPLRPLTLMSILSWPFGLAWNVTGLAWNFTWAILSFAGAHTLTFSTLSIIHPTVFILTLFPLNALDFSLSPPLAHLISRQSIASAPRSGPPPSAQRQDPQFAAARFLHDFESRYGDTHPDFYQGGYSQVLDAAKRELKFLLIILQSDEHDDTDAFCRLDILFENFSNDKIGSNSSSFRFPSDTLTSPALISYLHDNEVLVWGGNVRESEGFQVSTTLQSTTFPFLAIIALQYPASGSGSSINMSVVDRLEGSSTADAIIRRLEGAVQRHGPPLERVRRERQEREHDRMLREQQDLAYRESLRADQEKARKAREAREAAVRAEEEAQRALAEEQRRAEDRLLYRRYLLTTLPVEPAQDSKDGVARLSFRMMDGERVVRRFRGDESVEVGHSGPHVLFCDALIQSSFSLTSFVNTPLFLYGQTIYRFIESYPLLKEPAAPVTTPPANYEHRYEFLLVSPFPRTTHRPDTVRLIRDETGLWPSANLIVEEMGEEGEEAEA